MSANTKPCRGIDWPEDYTPWSKYADKVVVIKRVEARKLWTQLLSCGAERESSLELLLNDWIWSFLPEPMEDTVKVISLYWPEGEAIPLAPMGFYCSE